MRKEFLEFKQDVNQQLGTNIQDVQEQDEKTDKVATWIEGMEMWIAEANAALQQTGSAETRGQVERLRVKSQMK